jgi:hypothetical protein
MAGETPRYEQTTVGPVYTRGDQAFLRDRRGNIVTVAASDAARLLDEDPNYLPVSAEDVAHRDVEIARSTLPEKAKAFAESAAAGAIDVPLIPVRAGLRTGQAIARRAVGDVPAGSVVNPDTLTGRAAVEGLVSGAMGERDEAKAAELDEQYRQAAAGRREANPLTAGAGTIAGQLPWAMVGPGAAVGEATAGMGLGARLAAQTAAGAVEGAAFGESQATDDAYIEDKPLTAEKLMASMGWGALIGGGASLGLGAAGAGLVGAKGAASRALGREAVSDEAAAAFSAAAKREAPTAAVTDATEARVAEAADSAGLNPAARRAAAQEEAAKVVQEAKAAAPTDWRAFTKEATPEAQYIHRDTVLNAASEETAKDLTGVLDRQRPIYDEIDNLQVKRGKIAEHLAADGVDETAVIGRAQEETAALRQRLDEMRAAVQARQSELATAGEAGPVQAKGKPKVSSAEKALRDIDAMVRDHEGRILAAENGADAIAEYDSMRRELAKKWRTARASAGSTSSYEGRALLEPVRDFAQAEYQRAASALMDEGFVGAKQAAAQKAVNNARVGSINGERFDLRPFVTQVGSDEGADFGGRVFMGNQDSIRAMLSGLGDGGGGTRAGQFSRFVDSQEATLRAIKENYALSAGGAQKLDEALASLQKMRESVSSATDAANAVNRAKARIEADQIGGGFLAKLAASTAVGASTEGVSGAAKGFARGLLGGAAPTLELQQRLASMSAESKLAAWLEGKIAKVSGTAGKGAAVVNRTAANIDAKVADSLDGFFDRLTARAQRVGEAARKPIALGRFAAAPSALKLFQGDNPNPQDAYRKRTEQLLVMNQNLGQGVRDRTTTAMGGISETAPRLTQHVAVAASRGVNYLLSHTPVPLRQPTVMQPGYRPVPSDLEIAQFAKRWAAVADPLTVLDDFQKGMVTYEQVDALKNVYPTLYQSIRVEALQRFAKLDAAGIPVPYQERLQADLMFDLNGAGDPTLDAGFALKVSGMMQASAHKVAQPHPSKRPANVAKSMASESQSIGATLRGAPA